MGLVVRRKVYEARLEEGWHHARITKITPEYAVNTQYGVRDQVTFVFTVNEIVDLRLRCTLSLGRKSRLFQLVTDLTGREPGYEYDLEMLLGRECQILVSHKTLESGDTWENIDKVKPVKKKQMAAPEDDFNEIAEDDVPF